ncbi:MAG: hypothetical protein AAF694_25320 [Bacteroidota bacterium]
MKEITLTLTVDEANQILDSLGKEPFNKVFQLINKIQQQANPQLNNNTNPPPNNPIKGN